MSCAVLSVPVCGLAVYLLWMDAREERRARARKVEKKARKKEKKRLKGLVGSNPQT